MRESLKLPRPKRLKDLPGYLWKLISGFFSRLFYIYRLVWETKPIILFAMLFMAVLGGVLPIASAYISRGIINTLVDSSNGTLENGLAMVTAWLVFQALYLFLTRLKANIDSIITRISGELVVSHIKVKIMKKARAVDMASFDRPEFYAKLENASREADRRPIQILSASFSVISTLISMITFIVILWAVSPAAPFIIIALAAPSAIINFHYRRKNVVYMRFRSKERRQMYYYSDLVVNKDMVKEVRMFDLTNTFISRFKAVFKQYFAGLKKLFLAEGAWNMGIALVGAAVNCALFIYIAGKVVSGQLQVGDYTLYTGALASISGGITSLIATTATIYEGTLFIENMIDFMKEKSTVVCRLEKPAELKRGILHTIEFKNVSFRYPGTTRDVLKNINFKIEGGETVVLVGLNGAGKTTLLKLLTRLYDPTEGNIELDGRDIRDYDVKKLYAMFGMIFQDFGKYAVSVRENIAFGEISKIPAEGEVEAAAKASGAAEYIDRLALGYETPLMRIFEETGMELSIGQWQKLAAARAFYGSSDMVILDEPTSALDPMAEQEIYDRFDDLRKNKTTIFVSHRLSSATKATKIIVLEDGEIAEMGTHTELMGRKGRYHELFTIQAKRYITNENESIVGDGPPVRQTNQYDEPDDAIL